MVSSESLFSLVFSFPIWKTEGRRSGDSKGLSSLHILNDCCCNWCPASWLDKKGMSAWSSLPKQKWQLRWEWHLPESRTHARWEAYDMFPESTDLRVKPLSSLLSLPGCWFPTPRPAQIQPIPILFNLPGVGLSSTDSILDSIFLRMQPEDAFTS